MTDVYRITSKRLRGHAIKQIMHKRVIAKRANCNDVCNVQMFTLKQTHMTKILIAPFITALLFTIVLDASAGRTNNQLRSSFISTKGYWVVKDAGNTKQVTVLYFTNANELVRKETRLKRNADLGRKRNLRSLKRSLEEAIEWAKPI